MNSIPEAINVEIANNQFIGFIIVFAVISVKLLFDSIKIHFFYFFLAAGLGNNFIVVIKLLIY